ncbi:MFS transporter [Sphingomonas sp. DBB INV C78]|uniref:MFS transporter n=1 Tax=Sphingomonas sp. DBB INV C78 TaxID=3349434 RepID=UPI0036D40499
MATAINSDIWRDTGAAAATTPPDRLPAGRLLAFSAVALPVAAAQMPLNVYLPAILAQHYGVPLAVLGTIFLIEKIWGAIADPIIGSLSDRTRNRFGRRRTWIAAGGAVFGLSALLLFFPVWGVTPLYLGLVLFAFYLGWSMIQIPFLAWSGEISRDYNERTRVATYQLVVGSAALLLVLVLPTLVDQFRPGDGPLKLGVMGGLLLITLVPSLFLTLRAFPEPPLPEVPPQRLPFGQAVRLVASNRLLMRILASDFAVTLGQNIRGTLFVFFVSAYMGLPHWASGLFLLQFIFGISAGPIWMKIGYRLGKHRAAVTGELVQVAINLGLLFVVPGQLGLLIALTVAQGFAQGSGNLMLRSMVADVADEHRLATGEDRTALFYSVFSISMKAAMAAAVGIALPLVAWLGFDPASSTNSPDALKGLLFVFALGPALAHLVSAALVHGFPLDAAAHARIRASLDQRDATPDAHIL